MKFLVVLAAFLYSANAQIVMSGQCANVKVQENFDIPGYTGVWNEIYRYEHVNQLSSDCVTATYTLNNGTVEVFNQQVLNGTRFVINGTAIPDPAGNGTGKLLVNFPTTTNEFSQYWVLSTDYTDYSFVYACTNLPNNNRRVSSWILSRTKTLSPAAIVTINPIMESIRGLTWDVYRLTSQSETSCVYNGTIEV